MSNPSIKSLESSVRGACAGREITEYVRHQQALSEFAARGGVVTVLPAEIAPVRAVAPLLAVYEPVTMSGLSSALGSVEPVMLNLSPPVRSVERLPLSHPAVHAEWARYSDEFTVAVAVALLSARLEMARRPAWPPTQDNAYHAALATLGV